MALPEDVCRCYGVDCKKRERCERYLQRKEPQDAKWVPFARTFVTLTEQKCDMFIKKEG